MTGVVIAEGLAFPEGPLFDLDGQLWCVELTGGAITRVGADTLTRFPVGGRPNGLALNESGDIWYCDAGRNEIRVFHPNSGQTECAVDAIDGNPLDAPNDLAFDTSGNLVFTCPGSSRQEPTGYVGCRSADGRVKRIADGLLFPNGLAFSENGLTLYLAETYARRVWRGAWDSANQTWSDSNPLFTTPGPNGPDGLALDRQGNVYAAIYGKGQICIADAAGKHLAPIETAGSNPSNGAFDPSGRLGLVVTEAETGRILSYPGLEGLRPFFGRRQ